MWQPLIITVTRPVLTDRQECQLSEISLVVTHLNQSSSVNQSIFTMGIVSNVYCLGDLKTSAS